MTKIQITPKYSEVKPHGFYVYIHRKGTCGTEFYVGKGNVGRGFSSFGRNKRWTWTAAKHGVLVDIIQSGMLESDAFILEEWIIAKLRHEGYDLCNMTNGGEGSKGGPGSGHKPVCCSNGMRFASIGNAVKWLNTEANQPLASTSAISHAADGTLYSAYGFAWWYDGQPEKNYKHNRERAAMSNKKAVSCSSGIDFDSAHDAVIWLKANGFPNAGKGNICRAIRNNGSACGMSWWYKDDKPREYVDPLIRRTTAKHKPIMRGDGNIYPSATDAVLALIQEGHVKANKSAITRASKSPELTAYGYTWEYL